MPPRRIALFLALPALLAACGGHALPLPVAPTGDTLTLARRLAIAERVHEVTRDRFAHWEAVRELDLDTLWSRYRLRVEVSSSRVAFDDATTRYFAALRNGHTWFVDDSLERRAGLLGFFAYPLDGHWTVMSSIVPGLVRGDEVIAFDGRPVDSLLPARRGVSFESSDRTMRDRLFSARSFFPARYTLTLADGRTIAVDRSTLHGLTPPRPETAGRWLVSDSVAYLRIPSFADPRFELRALELVRAWAAAPVLVIDVRGNGGGSTPIGLLQALLLEPAPSYLEASTLRTNPPTLLPKHRGPAWNGHPGAPLRMSAPQVVSAHGEYRGRLIVLADRSCASACEDFVMPLWASRRATIVGERTFGSSGQPVVVNLGDGMRFAVGAKREYFPDGSEFEGVGIPPTAAVAYTLEDVRAGRDAMLARALELARGH